VKTHEDADTNTVVSYQNHRFYQIGVNAGNTRQPGALKQKLTESIRSFLD
jgi:hypothetical protein